MPTATINGAELFYRDEGSGTALLLIHAFPMNSTMWEPQISDFSPSMRVIAPDLPGFGQSPPLASEPTLDTYADLLAGLLGELGIAQATVAGLSMGGYISFALLRRHASLVRALALADTKAAADTEAAKAKRFENAQIALEQGQSAIADRMLPDLLSANAAPALIEQVRGIIAQNSREGIAAALRAMAARPDSSDMLPSLAIPTSVIVGEADSLTPPDTARAMSEQIANSRVTVVPAAGHLANLEHASSFNAALAELFTRE